MALIVQKVALRAMTSIMLCCLEQEECLWQWAQAEQGTISKRNRIFHAVHCNGGCSALRGRMQCTAGAVAVHCVRNGKTDAEIYTPIPDK